MPQFINNWGTSMNELLFWLVTTCLFTSLLWAPYIVNSFFLNGILTTMQYPKDLQLSDWALRAKKAHANAIENLIVFASLILSSVLLLNNTGITELPTLILLAKIYFIVRVCHFIFYLFKIPYLRTLAFLVGFFVQVFFAVILLPYLF
jgi:uncharacterized MAPEG superfamily protein